MISSAGLHDALEAVSREINVKHGMLRVASDTCSGIIGVFCGRFITGAVITLTGEIGIDALRKLLSAKEGTFEFVDVSDEPVREVNQSLGVDLEALLSSVDLSLDSVLAPEQSLTGYSLAHDNVGLIDTSVEMESLAEDMNSPEAFDAEYVRADGSRGGQEAILESEIEASQRSMRASSLPDLNQSAPAAEAYAIEHDQPSQGSSVAPSKDEFSRLKTWPARNRTITLVTWSVIIVALIAGIVVYSPNIPSLIKKPKREGTSPSPLPGIRVINRRG